MNRIAIVALAAVLSHFTLACTAETSAPSPGESSDETASSTLDEGDDGIVVMPADKDLVDRYAFVPFFAIESRYEELVEPHAVAPAAAVESREKELVDQNAFDVDGVVLAPSFDTALVIAPK